MKGCKFSIPIPPRTKKNHQQIVSAGGKRMVIPSKQYREYEEAALYFVPRYPLPEGAYNVKALFYMDSRRRVDLVNLEEALLDVIVRAGILPDDNSKVIRSMDGSRVFFDKERPRTEVEITLVGDEDEGIKAR